MSIVKILAPLTGGARDGVVLTSAFAAAEPFAAHVVALFVRPDPTEALPFFGEGVSGSVIQEVVDAAREAADKAAAETRARLAELAKDAGVAVTEAPVKRDRVTASFADVQGAFPDRATEASRLADLVVFGPMRDDDKPGILEAFEAVLLETGRPVFLAAKAPPAGFGGKVAVAWDGSQTCAHALSAALPFLAKAKSIELLMVAHGGRVAADCAEAHEYLRLHGLACSERTVEAGSRTTGEAILAAAADAKAGMLVLGGYGHSRFREMFVGGVTRHVVGHAGMPLFLVH